MDKLLRLPEVAELIGVPENTLRFWRHRGTGPKSARLGRRVVYRECDVLAWIDKQLTQQGRDRALPPAASALDGAAA